jgi:hypothetical protein
MYRYLCPCQYTLCGICVQSGIFLVRFMVDIFKFKNNSNMTIKSYCLPININTHLYYNAGKIHKWNWLLIFCIFIWKTNVNSIRRMLLVEDTVYFVAAVCLVQFFIHIPPQWFIVLSYLYQKKAITISIIKTRNS